MNAKAGCSQYSQQTLRAGSKERTAKSAQRQRASHGVKSPGGGKSTAETNYRRVQTPRPLLPQEEMLARWWHYSGNVGLLFCWLAVLCLGSAEILWGIMVQKSLWLTGEKACLITLSAGWEKPSRNFSAPSFFSLFFVFFFFRWFLLIICHPSPLI